MRISTVIALATVASTIWNNANRSPLAVGPKMPTTNVTTIVVTRNRGRVAHAASGMIAHSRYHGCTTGNSSTVAPSATPSPPTGCSRPRNTASSSQVTTTAIRNTPMPRVNASTAVVWSPRRSRMPTWPVPSASSVGGDIQLRTTFAVPSVNIQPKPRPLAHPITAITANGNTIYAGWCGPCNSGGSHPFASGIDTNYGGAWHTINAPNLPNRYIAGVTVDPKNPAHVFAVYNGYSRRWIPNAGTGHVFESTNGGSTFTDISGNLPDVPSDALVYARGDLALGTDAGAFFATDGQGANTTWSRLGTGLPNVSLNNLRLSPDGNTLLAATHGRGLWTLHLP